jgi:hypothetical protein
MFGAAGVILPGPVTYFTKELAKWRAGPKTKNNFSYKFTDEDCIKGGEMPVKKSKAPVLQTTFGNRLKSVLLVAVVVLASQPL